MISFLKRTVFPMGLVAVFASSLLLAGCASSGGNDGGFPGAEADAAAVGAAENQSQMQSTDILRPGDNLTVIYSDLPTPTPPFEGAIKQDGTITLIQNQTFVAAGKTRGQLETEIRERYVPRIYMNLTVTIKPEDRFYFVGGEVRSPGRQIYLGKMSVIKAIQSAGDFTEFANKKTVSVIRVNGRTERVNVPKAYKNPQLDIEIFPGDTVRVPRKVF